MDDTPTETTDQSDDAPSASAESTPDEPLFRREVLAAGAATGVAALGLSAGSAGAQSDGEFDRWFDTTQPDHVVANFQYNPNMWSGTTHIEHSLWAQYTHFDWTTGEFVPHLVESWDFGESEAELTLRDDFTWSDGSDLTADDLMTQWEVYELTEHALFEFATAVEATGDYEISISYPAGTNRDILRHAVLHEAANMPPQDWDDFGEDDGITSYEVSEPTASGPIELAEQDANYHQFEPREDHPYGANFNWNGYRMRHHDSNQVIHQALIDQEIDGLHSLFVGAATLNRFPDSIQEITFPGVFGMGMWFNHDREPWDDRAVRQAVAYSLDLQPILSSLGEDTKMYHPTQTGLTDVAVQEEFGGYDLEGFDSYERDPDTASQLVDDAGYTIGEIEPNYVVPAGWSDWILMSSLIGDQMGRAGWDVTVNTLGSAYYSARGNGDFDVVAGPHKDQAQHNNPYFALRFQLYGQSGTPAVWSNYGSPEGSKTVTIDGNDVDIKSTFESLASTPNESEQKDLVRTLAQVVNRDLPYIHVAQKYEQSFIDREQWAFPEEHPLLYTQWPMCTLPKTEESLDDHLEDAPSVETPGLLKAIAGGSTDPVGDEVTIGSQTVCDLDDDGEFEDVDCDGELKHADVQTFFEHQHRPAWKQPEYVDFDGNDRVGHGDVIELFQDVAGQSLE